LPDQETNKAGAGTSFRSVETGDGERPVVVVQVEPFAMSAPASVRLSPERRARAAGFR
jgi:hypothetical protein